MSTQPELGSPPPTTTKVDQVPSTRRCYDDLAGSRDKGTPALEPRLASRSGVRGGRPPCLWIALGRESLLSREMSPARGSFGSTPSR